LKLCSIGAEIKVQKKIQTFGGCCLFLSGQDATEKVVRVITFKTKQKEKLNNSHALMLKVSKREHAINKK